MGGDASVKTLAELSSSLHPADSRALAISGLAALDLKQAADGAAEALAAGADPAGLIPAFLNREGGADALAVALKHRKLPTDTARLSLRFLRGTASPAPGLTDALTSAAGMTSAAIVLSPERMQQMIAEVRAKGDAANGERIFRRGDTGCYQCHAISGGAAGWRRTCPAWGRSSPMDYLIDSVLDPNKAVKDGYAGYVIVTKSGDSYSGIKVGQDDKQLVIRDNAHLELAIPLADVKVQKEVGSLMPNGLTDTLTHQEVLDLVKFLSELGKPGPYGPATPQYVRRGAYGRRARRAAGQQPATRRPGSPDVGAGVQPGFRGAAAGGDRREGQARWLRSLRDQRHDAGNDSPGAELGAGADGVDRRSPCRRAGTDDGRSAAGQTRDHVPRRSGGAAAKACASKSPTPPAPPPTPSQSAGRERVP